MDAKAEQTLNNILMELSNISKEIDDVSNNLRIYKGIGTNDCTKKLNRISSKYNNARIQLQRIKWLEVEIWVY